MNKNTTFNVLKHGVAVYQTTIDVTADVGLPNTSITFYHTATDHTTAEQDGLERAERDYHIDIDAIFYHETRLRGDIEIPA